jgi:hypothetical protein
MEDKRFQVRGLTRIGLTPKESDGVVGLIGEFDTKEEAEDVQFERLKAGWGRVGIIDRDSPSTTLNGLPFWERLYDVLQRRARELSTQTDGCSLRSTAPGPMSDAKN